MTKLKLYGESANLGDNLMITPLLNHLPCKLVLPDEEWMRYTAEIFSDLCEQQWVNNRDGFVPLPYANIPRPWSKRLLVGLGFNDVPAIPKIKLSEQELEDGRVAVKHLEKNFGRPLCIIKGVPGRCPDRNVPTEIIDDIVAKNPGIKFITFNLGSGHPKSSMRSPQIKDVFELVNAPIRAEASIYAAVGRYVGADTGGYHLMLSVGGKADVLCPAHSDVYSYWHTHYGDDCWLDEAVRVTYNDFTQKLEEGITGVRL